jgi:two-component system chemotaxis response regulator CheB
VLVNDGSLTLSRGPKENRQRPSIDVLFRSGATAFRRGAIGVVLSGNLDDGTAGLISVKLAGGVALVQSPTEAAFPGMPASAIAKADVDHVAAVDEIGRLLGKLVETAAPEDAPGRDALAELAVENGVAAFDSKAARKAQSAGHPSAFVCPDCGGTLFETKEGAIEHYRCRVGHAYSEETLEAAKSEEFESALWAALRALEEHADLMRRSAARARSSGLSKAAERWEEAAVEDERRAEPIRALLTRISRGRDDDSGVER